jgi:hypothetical protein
VNEDQALPTLVSVTQAFCSRMPSQRLQDALTRIEGGTISELLQAQTFRVVAFRKLMEMYPGWDTTSLWAHCYDVEVEVKEVDPTNGSSPIAVPPSGATGVSTLTP